VAHSGRVRLANLGLGLVMRVRGPHWPKLRVYTFEGAVFALAGLADGAEDDAVDAATSFGAGGAGADNPLGFLGHLAVVLGRK
jgi:hypothetical protein